MKRHSYAIVTLLAIVGLVVSACAAPGPARGPAPGGPVTGTSPTGPKAGVTGEQQLIDAIKAKGEKEIVFWSTSWVLGPVEKAFEARYPFVKLKSADIQDLDIKLLTEYKAGRYTPDVVYTTTRRLVRLQRDGVLKEYEWPNVVGWQNQPPTPFWKYLGISLYTPMVNTRLVSPADTPKRWEDLNDARWRGQAIMSMSAAEYPILHAYLLGDVTSAGIKWDRSVSFWKEAVRNVRPAIVTGFKGPLERLTVGEMSIMLLASAMSGLQNIRTGAPIDFVPIKKITGGPFGLALTSHPPNPNAARLFLDWATSEEGALAIANTLSAPTFQPGAAKKAYANLYFQRLGIEWSPVPEELPVTDDDYLKAADLWLKDILGVTR